MVKLKTDVLIIGAGLAGLSFAIHTERDYLILEKEERAGGLARTEREGDFLFDYTGHLLHLKNDYTRSFITGLLKDNLNERDRNSWIFSKNTFTRYPFQKNTYGLPPEIIKEILLGFINRPEKEVKSFGDWIDTNFGEGIARHFMNPYNTKLWTVEPDQMTTDWLGGFVPNVTIEELIDGALFDSSERVGYNAFFYYPEKDGIEALVKAMLGRVEKDYIKYNEEVTHIDFADKKVRTAGGMEIEYNHIINTSPLKQFVNFIQKAPEEVSRAADKLKYNSVYNHNFALKGERFKDRDWIYLPEPEFVCYRVGTPTNFSDSIAPDGYTTVYTEVSYSDSRTIEKPKLREKLINSLKDLGYIESENDIVSEKILEIPIAYVIYDFNRADSLNLINKFLGENDILSIGRYGKWEYSAMEDAILQGKEAAEELIK